MPLRTFLDEDGIEWRVWEVVPGSWRSENRRKQPERRSPEPLLRHTPERRSGKDRRRPTVVLKDEMAGGWLTFESNYEKRRLMPVPFGWERLSDADLVTLCRRGKLVPRIESM